MNTYWQQWSAQEIDYCLGRDFRAPTKIYDIEDSDFDQDDDTEIEEDEEECYELSLDSLGMSNSDFF